MIISMIEDDDNNTADVCSINYLFSTYIYQLTIGLGGGSAPSSSSYGSDNVPSSSSKSNAKKPFTGFED